jgi:hypothetical protein
MQKSTEQENTTALSCVVNDQGILKIPKELLALVGITKEESVMIIPAKDHLKIYTSRDFCKIFGDY